MTTIHIGQWEVDGNRLWSKLQVRKLLKIKQRQTLNDHLIMLGLSEPLTDAHVREVFLLMKFLRAGDGPNYSRSNYLQLKSEGLLASKFEELGIDINNIDKEFEELINANNTEEIVSGNRSRISGSNPRSQGVCCP